MPRKKPVPASPEALEAAGTVAPPLADDATLAVRLKEREAKIAELEAKVRGGEEAALARVCKHLGVLPQAVKDQPEAPQVPLDDMIVAVDVYYPININGKIYRGRCQVPYPVAATLRKALGDRRMRILNELTGNNYILRELGEGQYAPRLVGAIDITGERVL